MTTNSSATYVSNIKSAIAGSPTFKAICDYNVKHYQQGWYETYKSVIANGTGDLKLSEHLITYLAAYGDMHRHKLNHAFCELFKDKDLIGQSVEIVDWGCGQAFASCVLIDYTREYDIKLDIFKFNLIEPSTPALTRGSEHIEAIYQRIPKPEMVLLNEKADNLSTSQLQTSGNVIKIHLFSNLLDICTLSLQNVVRRIKQSQKGANYFVCVSPNNNGSSRLKLFYEMFPDTVLLSTKVDSMLTQIFRPSSMRKVNHSVSRVQFIFKTNL